MRILTGMISLKQAILLFSFLAFCLNSSFPVGAQAAGSDSIASLPNPVATATPPSDTDSRITTFNDPHMSWLPITTARNQLLVYLPGTGGKPTKHFAFTETAASLGYHSIYLMYPDKMAAQIKCSQSTDPHAYIKFRLAIIQGGVIGPKRTIESPDSIDSRLAHLLLFLDTKQPKRGWGQFLDAQKQIKWNLVSISGGSQGGGHAYIIGKVHKVARVIMLGAPKDYSFYFNAPSLDFDSRTKTPLDRMFSFNHVKDNGNGCSHAQNMEILKQIGLLTLGIVDADQAGANFKHGHVITTDVPLPNHSKGFHGSVHTKLPVCVQTWKYMLTEPVQ